jgi:ABC-type transport system involved in multi-copper enzyme maturation permease subunit
MDALVPSVKTTRIKRWLPYWAVFQADVAQTLRSWVYRTSVLIALLAAVGYLLYRVAVYKEAGIIQSASHLISDLLRWSVLGGVALVILVTGGSISSERGILADSVLSRGISRYQYFLGKWHARLAIVIGTFLAMGLVALVGSYFFLNEDLSLLGSLLALATVIALLAVVATCGVAFSALFNSTVVGIAVLGILLYALGFGLALLPADYPTPDRALSNLPHIIRGLYDWQALGKLMGCSLAGSFVVAMVGLGYFARRDV